MTTKLQKLLNNNGLTQGDLILKIQQKYGIELTRSYVSKICAGVITNYTVRTALIFSETLGVKLDDIIDTEAKKEMKKEIAKKLEMKANKKEQKIQDEAISHPGVVL
jgi:transcriptional regulator with XRE-family HTH domain